MTDSANLELVRSIYADWEQGDFGTTEWLHPEIEYVVADGPLPGSYTGIAELLVRLRDWLNESWEEWRIEADDYCELDEERVLALIRFSARPKGSDFKVGQMWAKGASLLHICDGRVTRLVNYWDRDRALADLGLVPEGDLGDPSG